MPTDFVEILKRGFRYDCWANRLWLDHLGRFKDMERPFSVMEHILTAQQIWLERCGGALNEEKANLALEQLFAVTSRSWIDLISEAEPNEVIAYQNFKGENYEQALGDIALHVLNHGTYHRGQLRGLAQAEGLADFPETDLILYLREQREA